MVLNRAEVLASVKSYYQRIIKKVIEIEKHDNFNREYGYTHSKTWKSALQQSIMVNETRSSHISGVYKRRLSAEIV